MIETYENVAYLGLRDDSGKYIASIPLYVKTSDIPNYDISSSREDMVRKIAQILMKHYQRQMTEFVKSKQNEKLQELQQAGNNETGE